MDYFKALLYGILEGITEWLPISSTAHLILLGKWLKMEVSESFMEMFNIVIQLGAISAVIYAYRERLNPFSNKKNEKAQKEAYRLWNLVLIAIIPSGIVGLLWDDWVSKRLHSTATIGFSLIAYGLIFYIFECYYKAEACVDNPNDISWKKAIFIGLFQALSIIPGTSRSGSTMTGALCVGLSRQASTEISFFMAIPTMFGYSVLKMLKYFAGHNQMTMKETYILLIAFFTAAMISFATVKWLVSFVKKHSFLPFAIYRIILGSIILLEEFY